MEVMPILATLRRNKVGAVLVALQIALTLAVVANALSVIGRHWTDMTRPSGLDEPNIFSMSNQWVGKPDDLQARIEADMAALRALPGVIDAEATNSFPLSSSNWGFGIALKPRQTTGVVSTSLYLDTIHGLAAQGLKLVDGRWFAPDEVIAYKDDLKPSATVVLTAALAQRLFPDGHALGRSVYLINDAPARVVGIVERASSGSGSSTDHEGLSSFLPIEYVNNYMRYVVRTKPGQLQPAMGLARQRLLDLSRMRIIDRFDTFSGTRTKTFAVAAATSWLLATVCALLLVITACGTVGLTMCWVAQRRRQIGMRRALGARRTDILSYFHTENLLIAGTGAVLGVAGGLGANLWLTQHLAMTRMNPMQIVVGAVIVLILSQLAVLWPAVRAATVPPSLAARGL
jgi:putative ABC transport system permease protein